jgi:hypothetical protein
MGDFFGKYKTAIFLVILAVIGFGGYITFFGTGTPVIVTPEPVGQELFAALEQIQNVQLDTSVLDNPVFGRLNDFGLTITRQSSGRTNPFVPVPPNTQGPAVSPISRQVNETATTTPDISDSL